jgi:hypothetical protein
MLVETSKKRQYFDRTEMVNILKMLEGDKGDAHLAIEILSGERLVQNEMGRFLKSFMKGRDSALMVSKGGSTTKYNPSYHEAEHPEMKEIWDKIKKLEERYDLKRLQAKIKRKYK